MTMMNGPWPVHIKNQIPKVGRRLNVSSRHFDQAKRFFSSNSLWCASKTTMRYEGFLFVVSTLVITSIKTLRVQKCWEAPWISLETFTATTSVNKKSWYWLWRFRGTRMLSKPWRTRARLRILRITHTSENLSLFHKFVSCHFYHSTANNTHNDTIVMAWHQKKTNCFLWLSSTN